MNALTVQRVDASHTVNPAIVRHLITLSDGRQFTTIHPWLASLADRYRERQTPVECEAVWTRFGMVLQRLSPARKDAQ